MIAAKCPECLSVGIRISWMLVGDCEEEYAFVCSNLSCSRAREPWTVIMSRKGSNPSSEPASGPVSEPPSEPAISGDLCVGSLQRDRELLVSAFAEALERADDRAARRISRMDWWRIAVDVAALALVALLLRLLSTSLLHAY